MKDIEVQEVEAQQFHTEMKNKVTKNQAAMIHADLKDKHIRFHMGRDKNVFGHATVVGMIAMNMFTSEQDYVGKCKSQGIYSYDGYGDVLIAKAAYEALK